METVQLPEAEKVSRVRIREFNDSWVQETSKPGTASSSAKKAKAVSALHAIEFFGASESVVLSVGFFHNKNAQTREFKLQDDERIIGFSSRIEKRY